MERLYKETAVEWLQMKMATSSLLEMAENINEWFKQSKEMDEEQRVGEYLKGWDTGYQNIPDKVKKKINDNRIIMTPKEKARELIDAVDVRVALFVVNEIIESRKEDSAFDDIHFAKGSKYYTPHPMYFTYWNEVKNEIYNHKSK